MFFCGSEYAQGTWLQTSFIFEILQHVHRLRGTKVPVLIHDSNASATLTTTVQSASGPSSNQNFKRASIFRPAQPSNTNASPSQKCECRRTGTRESLEAIAPIVADAQLRHLHTTRNRQSSPQKENTQAKVQTWLDEGFAVEVAKRNQGVVSPVRGIDQVLRLL